ncbi:type 1 fimbrial protein [Serratia marcescens]|nr:type 1 fimbrial protein [Serratia marcescens]
MQIIDSGCNSQERGALTRRAGQAALLALVLLTNRAESGNHGMLFVHGALTEGACRLEMSSAYQDIWLGETTTSSLAVPGNRTQPVAFQLRLRDCTRMGAAIRDTRLGYRLLDADNRDVRLGSRSRPQLLALGDNGLQFYVMAERTRAPLLAGAYRAAIDFRLNYD